jgi:cytosine/adenosine deaminase-related metal-dependent hydrolase
MLSENGYRSLGWDGGGKIAQGSWCDLVAVRTDAIRTSGIETSALLWAAGPGDVAEVVVGGRSIVRDGVHLLSSE